jgi:isoquinoline 1-oxidoreductase alpha subunit
MRIEVNGVPREVLPEWRDETLLSVLREHLGLVGTRFGCGEGACGACTVLLDGDPTRSCSVPAADAAGRSVRTVEGLAGRDGLHPVQRAWLEERVAQCGYCQSGQIMAAVALLERSPDPSDAEIAAAMEGNLCRCGTQARIRRAVRRAAGRPA